jgi:hypothetical protein
MILNDLNFYLLYLTKEYLKQLYCNDIIEVLHQAKTPKYHEVTVSTNITIFEMSYEEHASYSNVCRAWRRSGEPMA